MGIILILAVVLVAYICGIYTEAKAIDKEVEEENGGK